MEKRDALSDVEKFRSGRDEREKEREKKKKKWTKRDKRKTRSKPEETGIFLGAKNRKKEKTRKKKVESVFERRGRRFIEYKRDCWKVGRVLRGYFFQKLSYHCSMAKHERGRCFIHREREIKIKD